MLALFRRRCPAPPLMAALLSLGMMPLASTARAQGYVAYPSTDTMREVQLAALVCARENTSDTCTRARKLADPLMDHPRLPGGCKDALWAIIQKSTPASTNTLARRDAIGDPAGRLLLRNLFRADPKMAPFRDDPEVVAMLAEPTDAPVGTTQRR